MKSNNTQNDSSNDIVIRRAPAMSAEERENELIALAYDRVEQRIRDNEASSQELVHFLRRGARKERLEEESLLADIQYKRAKSQSLNSVEELKDLYKDAIKAFKEYSGDSSDE